MTSYTDSLLHSHAVLARKTNAAGLIDKFLAKVLASIYILSVFQNFHLIINILDLFGTDTPIR